MTHKRNNEIFLYSSDIDSSGLKDFLHRRLGRFEHGLAAVELHQENFLGRTSALPMLHEKTWDVLAARFFDGTHQVKVRRLDDDVFRLVADFPMDGFKAVAGPLLPGPIHCYALWGTHLDTEQGSRLYEERIPILFDYPGAEGLAENERMAIRVRHFLDSERRTVWDRFETLIPWARAPKQDPWGWLKTLVQRMKDLLHGRF
jgi:hypothetical protein